jgi:membrane-associated phospholipid phosphatase
MRSSPRLLLAGAAACAVAYGLVMLAAFVMPGGTWVDGISLAGLSSLRASATISSLATGVVAACDTAPFALLASALVVFSLATRGLRRTAAVALLLGGANLSSQLLKPLSEVRPASAWSGVPRIDLPSFPSGHATAAMSLALAAVLVAPRAWRPFAAAVGGAFAVGVGVSTVIEIWHYPSDVIGGFLLATGWALVALAALRAVEARWPEAGTIRGAARHAIAPVGAPLVAVAALAGLVIAALHADEIARFAQRHTTAAGMVGAIALSAGVLLAAVAKLAGQPAR